MHVADHGKLEKNQIYQKDLSSTVNKLEHIRRAKITILC